MGLFSFGKKDDAPSGRDAYSDSSRGARQTVRTERRTRRSERPDADAMMLDPTLPEKQRARRRLVGAIALVLAAVIVLPMVLDSRPKPVTDDISIDIPSRPVVAPKPARAETPPSDADTQAGVAPDGPPANATATATTAAPSASSASAGVARPAVNTAQNSGANATATAKPEAKAPVQAAPTKPAAKPATPPAPSAAESDEDGSANSSASTANTPSSPPGSRFVLQIGAFDDETAAQNWVGKLKSAGVPAYVEHRKQADGSTRSLLRAGPFADRAAATAALAKVRQAGLGGSSKN